MEEKHGKKDRRRTENPIPLVFDFPQPQAVKKLFMQSGSMPKKRSEAFDIRNFPWEPATGRRSRSLTIISVPAAGIRSESLKMERSLSSIGIRNRAICRSRYPKTMAAGSESVQSERLTGIFSAAHMSEAALLSIRLKLLAIPVFSQLPGRENPKQEALTFSPVTIAAKAGRAG